MNKFESLRSIRPIVIGGRKKKKRKYSRGLGELQVVGGRLTKVTEKAARDSVKGLRMFLRASEKSSRRKQDGAIRDLGVNLAKGVGKSLEESSAIPEEVARALSTRKSRKSVRRRLKITARLSRALGLK